MNSKRQLYQWKTQISIEGTRLENLKKISEYALNQFKESIQKSITVHDFDIRRWALKARDEVSSSPNIFKGFVKWVHEFKHKHRIVSRKINKFVTQKSIINKNKLEKDTNELVQKMKYDILFSREEGCHALRTVRY